jgi:hypothetical protein
MRIWSKRGVVDGLGIVFLVACMNAAASAGAFSVVISENPPLTLEGIATPRGDGTADVQSAWVLDSSPIGAASLPLRGRGDDPRVQINLHMIADIDPDTGQVTSYTKWAVLTVLNINYPESPVPNGLSLMSAMAPGASGGWNWSGFLWVTEDEIWDSIESTGSPLQTSASPSPCQNLPFEGDTRQLIPLGNNLWLLIVVRADGSVHMIVYEQGEDGCWQVAFYPSLPGDPGWPGGTISEPLPPDHTFDESMAILWHAWLVHAAEGEIIGIPGGPVGAPG